MLDKVTITNKQGDALTVPFLDGADGLFIQEVEGLDPVNAVLVSSSFAQVDGEQHQASRREARFLVFKMGVDVSQIYGSVTSLRRKLMNYLMPKAEVNLRLFSDDHPTVDIVGVVESFDWPLFVQEPEVTLSIKCHKPDFMDLVPVTLSMATDPAPLNTLIEYSGSSETGFIFRLTVDRAISEFTMQHRTATNALSTLEFAEPLVAGDVLTISTVTGAKAITVNRSGSVSSLMYGMSPYSNWINLFPGRNYLSVVADGAPMNYTIEYVTRYGGL